MAKIDTILASLPDFSIEELSQINTAVNGQMEKKALESLHEAEVKMNVLREQAGLKRRPLTRDSSKGGRKAQTNAKKGAGKATTTSTEA